MRVIVNLICLCIFLLGGGQHLHSATHVNIIYDSPSFNFVKQQQIKVKASEQGNVIIEEADTDLDEEFCQSDANKIFAVKQWFLDSSYFSFSNAFIYKDYSKQIEMFTPDYGGHNPIYLQIGALRI